EMQETALIAQGLGDGRHECDHVVMDLGLDLLHARDVHPRVTPQRAGRVGRYLALRRQLVDECQLDVEPAPEPRLFGPDPRHLRARVAGDHRPSPGPVLPKPPSPRSLRGSAATSCHAMRVTGAITSCAMRSPRRRVTRSRPRFTRRTWISPR